MDTDAPVPFLLSPPQNLKAMLRSLILRWPDGINYVPGLRNRTDDTEDTEETDVTDETDATQEVKGSSVVVLLSCVSALPDVALARALPELANDNHRCLFRLAREVRTHEQQNATQFDGKALRATFDRWHSLAQPYLQAGQTPDEYFMEFMSGYRRVKYLIGENVLLKAWEKTIGTEPPPQLAELIAQDSIRRLACFCRELQREWGDKPFFLSCRTVQGLFDGISLSTVSLWLRGLEACGVIKIVEKGTQKTGKASRFQYLLSVD